MLEALLVLAIDGLPGSFSKALTIEILRLDLWNVPSVTRDVLSLNVLIRSTNPILATFGGVSVLQLVINSVLRRRGDMIIILIVVRFRDSYFDLLFRWLLAGTCD